MDTGFKNKLPEFCNSIDVQNLLGNFIRHQDTFYKYKVSTKFQQFCIIDPDLTVDLKEIDRLYNLYWSDTRERRGYMFCGHLYIELIARMDESTYLVAQIFSANADDTMVTGSIIICYDVQILSNILYELDLVSKTYLGKRSTLRTEIMNQNRYQINAYQRKKLRQFLLDVQLQLTEDHMHITKDSTYSDDDDDDDDDDDEEESLV